MTQKIKSLTEKINQLSVESLKKIETLKIDLQIEWDKVFNDSKSLNKAIENAMNSSKYTFNEHGDIVSWYCFSGLSEYDNDECREYFESWLIDHHCMTIDWKNECFILNHGDSNIIIQDDTRHDNGVWQNSKIIIDESEYKDENDEIDETKRNELIESHMNKTGHFPGVFKVDYNGNVWLVNTKT